MYNGNSLRGGGEMKYSLVVRNDKLSLETAARFREYAEKYQLVNDEKEPAIVISIGGDGTFLDAFQQNRSRLEEIAFLGIHTGHLGFYADWQIKDIETLAAMIAANNEFKISQYPLVKVFIYTTDFTYEIIALNEFVVKSLNKSLVMKVRINDFDFETFRGDGLCVATPSGSTAYNKSIGGAIIHPSFESIQLSEIASLNNRVYRTIGSSLLLPKEQTIQLFPEYDGELSLSYDHLYLKLDKIQSITCAVAEEKIRFIRYRPFPFWSRVANAFIGEHHKD